MRKATTKWAKILATLTPEQLRLYEIAEAEWQADLDAYIEDYKRQAIDFLLRGRQPVPNLPASSKTRQRAPGHKRGASGRSSGTS